MQSQTADLDRFLNALNAEADTAAAAMGALLPAPIGEWRAILLQQPSWCRYGTFDALLQYGRSIIYSEPRRALDIASFVLLYAEDVRVAPGAELLKPLLLGTALKQQANAYYALQEYSPALTAVERSLQVFEAHPELTVDHAAALLAYAQITHELSDTVGALEAVRESVGVFDSHAQPKKYLMALEVCGQFLMDQRKHALAQEVYRTASTVAERLDDEQTLLRMHQARGACAVYLGDLEEATHHLTRAFLGFERQKMHTALQRAIWGIARVARERDELEDALEALHGVYAEFLHRGMLPAAAEVLVELGDIVAEMTGDVAYAHEMTKRLDEAMGAYDVPGNVRDAVEYLHRTTQASPSVTDLRYAFAHVRRFFEVLTDSPLTAFAVPA